MAGGEGTRLRPLTLSMPKPLVPVNGLPAMTHILRLLYDHGVREAAVTLRYMGGMIRSHYGSTASGIALEYFTEDKPLGTAGSVKAASRFCDGDEPFIVISGDTVCETDISAAVSFHRTKNADVTIVLTKVEVPLEYGVVMTNSEGRVTRFLEKPSWKQAFSDTVNTGIYIISPRVMKLIPDGCAYDFGRQLFPRMLEEGRAVYGYADSNYWCDIGSLRSYLECNMRYSEGKSVIASGCDIAPDAVVMRSVVLGNVSLGSGSVLDGAIVCPNTVIGKNSGASPGAVIGSECVIGDNVRIAGGVRIFPSISLDDGAVVTGDVLSQPQMSKPSVSLEDERISIPMSGGSAYSMRLGEAVGCVCGRVGVMSASSDRAHITASAFGCGVTSSGGECVQLGDGAACEAEFMAQRMYLPITAYCTGEHITLCDRYGLPISRELERAITDAMSTDSFAHARGFVPSSSVTHIDAVYTAALGEALLSACGIDGHTFIGTESAPRPLDGLSFSFEDNHPSQLTASVLRRFGAECSLNASPEAVHLAITPDGHDITMQYGGIICDRWHTLAILLSDKGINSGISDSPVLPYPAPMALERAAASNGMKLLRRSDDSPVSIRSQTASRPWLYDMCFAAVTVAALLKDHTLGELYSELPDFSSRAAIVDSSEADKTHMLGKLCSADFAPDGEGVVYSSGRARIRVVPRRGRGFVLYADNDDAEFADELTAMARRVMKEK